MSCNRCKTTTSDLFNFLLSCSDCEKKWHHRCHIPPLSDPELTALLRATNDNDVDNGLDSWIGKCCKKKRTWAPPISEKALGHSVSTSAIEIRHDRQSHTVSPAIETPVDVSPIHKAQQQKTLHLLNGVTTAPKPDNGLTVSDFRLNESEGRVKPQTIPVQSVAQHPSAHPDTSPLLQDISADDDQLSRLTPHLSISSRSILPSFGGGRSSFVPYSRPAHLREGSMALAQTATHQQPELEPTRPYLASQLPTHSASFEGTSNAPPKSTATSANSQTLDLRALLLSRASGPSKAPQRLLISRPMTSDSAAPASTPPVPPVASIVPEDDEMEDLYGPPLGLPSPYAPQPRPTLRLPPPSPPREPSPTPSLQFPAELEGPPLLPMLAAKDPRVLAMLERQERREATRPRRGKCKPQPVHGAGKKRGGFVLVSNWTMAGAAHAEQGSWQTGTRR